MNNSPFKNPYSGQRPETLKPIIFDVDINDYHFIKCIRPSQSTLSGLSGTMWKKTVESLKNREIHDVSNESQFEHFIRTCHIISDTEYERLVAGRLLDSSAGGIVPDSNALNDGGGKTSESNRNTTNAPVVSNVQGKSGKGKSIAKA